MSQKCIGLHSLPELSCRAIECQLAAFETVPSALVIAVEACAGELRLFAGLS